jgi:hypothetical protein
MSFKPFDIIAIDNIDADDVRGLKGQIMTFRAEKLKM